MTSLAALPMYDGPAVRRANDALWRWLAAALRARDLEAPVYLERHQPPGDIWRDPNLLFAQTCGYPFATELTAHLRLLATPCYAAAGCEGAFYSSHIVVRRNETTSTLGDMAGRIAAINSFDSQSGFVALQLACAGGAGAGTRRTPFFSQAVITGNHLGSLRAVAAGEADVAAIDAICWALAERDCPQIAGQLKSIATTPLTPGLPFVTAAGRPDAEVALIRSALAEVLADPASRPARDALLITGMEIVDQTHYCAAYCRVDEDAMAALIPPVPSAAHPAGRSTIAPGRLR